MYSKTSFFATGSDNLGALTNMAIDQGLAYCQIDIDIVGNICTIEENSVFIVLPGKSLDVSVTSADIRGCFQFAIRK